MRVLSTVALLVLLAALSLASASDRVYRLGLPAMFTTPVYSALVESLEAKGYVEGRSIIITRYDLDAIGKADEESRNRARAEINSNDLFFATCDQVQTLYDLNVSTPVLFFGADGLNRRIPQEMQRNVTGIWKGSITDMLVRMDRLVPATETTSDLGMIYIDGTDIENMAPRFKSLAATKGITIVPKGYRTTDDLVRVMEEFAGTVKAVIVVPPAVTPENVPLLVDLQNRLNLPLVTQLKSSVEAGMFGGTVLNMDIIMPKLSEYSDKILRGRTPSQLPVFTADLTYVINLEAASLLGVKAPRSVLKQAEIIGIAQGPSPRRLAASRTLVPGRFRLAIPENTIISVRDMVLTHLAGRGYVVGRNLEIVSLDLDMLETDTGTAQLRDALQGVNAVFVTDSAATDIARLKLDLPVVFMGVSDTTPIPDDQAHNFTGVWRTSCQKSLDMARRMFPDTRRIALVHKDGARMDAILAQNRDAARNLGIVLTTASFTDTADIAPLMNRLKGQTDLVLLLPATITDEDIRAFVSMQDKLDLPVLSQLESHIRMGLAGGPALDLDVAVPRLTDFIDKIFKGRSPSQLKTYRFTPKYVINIAAASRLDVRMSRSIIQQSSVVGRGDE